MTEMNAAPMNDEEEKQPFYKTPLGIILIIVGVILICCCLAGIIVLASGGALVEGLVDNPEFQKALEDIQMTVEAAE